MKKLLILIVSLVLLFGCSSRRPMEMPPRFDRDTADMSTVPESPEIDNNQTFDPTKIVKSADFRSETRNFDDAINTLNQELDKIDGFIQNSTIERSTYTQLRTAYYTFKIPADNLSNFLDVLRKEFTITSESTRNTSVSDTYFDAENRIKVLTTQQDRLLELVKDAKTVEEIVFLQEQLMNVEEELEYNKGTLQKLDDQINYSSVNFTITELSDLDVASIDDEGFFSELARAFIRGFEKIGDALINFVYTIAENIVLIVIVGGFITYLVKRGNKKKKK